MAYKQNSASDGQGAIYTLAQNGTTQHSKQPIILTGKGSDMSAIGYGTRKCKKKAITDALVLKMIDLAKRDGREDLVKSFWNTWHCMNRVFTHENRLYFSHYCKNRYCTICLGIRKAVMIDKYYPILEKWADPHLVTLTARAVTKKRLNEVMKALPRGLNKIIDKYEKIALRGNGKKLVGIRSLECNFNPIKSTYNPHMHFIVPDLETAQILKAEWLRIWKYDKTLKVNWTVPKAQDIRRITELDTALIEVIKYGTKVFTDIDNREKPKGIVKLYVRAYYNIIKAMKGLRLFSSFGFILPEQNKEGKIPARLVTDYDEWKHAPELQNWQHTEKWEMLFDQLPDAKLEELLQWGIDKELD